MVSKEDDLGPAFGEETSRCGANAGCPTLANINEFVIRSTWTRRR